MNKQIRILFTLCTVVTLFSNAYSSLILEENPAQSAADKALNSFTFLGNAEPKMGGLHDYIFKTDRKTLIKWAITAEAHYFVSTKLNNEDLTEAWIYNRISDLSDADLAKYILKMASKYPELDSNSALDALAASYGITDEIVNFVSNKANKKIDNNSSGKNKNSKKKNRKQNKQKKLAKGLHTVLENGDRLTLIKWALTAEAHLHSKNGSETKTKIVGGMYDYIHTLTNEQILKYITIAAKNHSELNSKEKMEELAEKYGITEEIALEKHAKGEPEPEFEDEFQPESSENHCENLHELIANGDRKLLIKWALVAEALLNQGAHGKLAGGLHDYVNSFSNEQLGKFIAVAAKNHPELNSKEHMEKLADDFQISSNDAKENEAIKEEEKESSDSNKDVNKFLNRGNFNFNLFISEQKDDLFSWALAAEKYDKEKHNLHLLEGGLENYIMHLNKDQLADFIVTKTKKYPELTDKNYLEYLARRFGYKKF